ncbi:MAG: Hsp70 family protein [Acidimicrobiales bacterium]|nr:Hsp70 family protein [Acidimicrobiales bacterium]
MWNLAIDFGTSNTTGATWADGVVEAVEAGQDRKVPSVVLLGDDGRWVVGREADNQSAVVPERVERAPKRRLGKGKSLLLGGQAVPITSAVAALMAPHRDAARARRGGEPMHVVLTHPARWGPERLDVLRSAAAEAGFTRVELLPEPVAAAHYVDEPMEVGRHIAVYDLGGGTFDTCVVKRTETSYRIAGLPGGNERIGGEDFDHRLYTYLGEAVGREDPAAWDNMQHSDDRSWRRAATDLLNQAREAKEQLSRNPRASVYVGAIERDVSITREEFEGLISDDIDRTVAEMVRTIESTGLRDEDIDRVYLVGGSSRLPLVQQRMGERFGGRISTWDDPKGAVVLGAARFSGTLTPERSSQTPPVAAPGGAPTVAPAPGTWTPPPAPGAGPVVGAPPPRAGTDGAPTAPVAPPSAPPPVPPATPATVPPAASAPPGAPTYGAAPGHGAPAGPGYGAPGYGTPAYGAPAPPTPGPVGYPTAPTSSSNNITFAWIGAATFLICCLPGPAVGAYFANEARKEGHPQGQTALILNIVALALTGVFWMLWFLSVLATSGSTTN